MQKFNVDDFISLVNLVPAEAELIAINFNENEICLTFQLKSSVLSERALANSKLELRALLSALEDKQ